MTKKALLIQLLVITLLASACTSYRSKSGIKFPDADVYGQQPKIQVGEIEETPDQISFVAKIDAVVKRPSIFHKPATREQVNIVLGEKGASLGADAVTYIEYEEKFGHVWASGQAVKINSLYQKQSLPSPPAQTSTVPPSVLPVPEIATVDTPPAYSQAVATTRATPEFFEPPEPELEQPGTTTGKKPLTQTPNRDLALILGSLEELENYKPFNHSNLVIRVFTSKKSTGQCWRTLDSCPDTRLFIAVDPGDIYDTPKLYELPSAKGWRLDRKLKTVEDTVGLQLSTTLPQNANIDSSDRNAFQSKIYTVWLGLTPSYEVR